MVKRQDLEIKNPWWRGNEFVVPERNLPKRDMYFVLEKNLTHSLILNIVGLRRVGKSTIQKQLINHLLVQKKVAPNNVFYFLFDYSSQIQKAEFLDEVLSFYFKEIVDKPSLDFDNIVYVFLDEIQYIENWQSVLKKYYDLSNKKIKFIVTGSQSILLKGKNHESLAGRVFDYYLPPLSFREFIKIREEKIDNLEEYDLFEIPRAFGKLTQFDIYNAKKINELSREYIISGQFPETKNLELPEQRCEYIAESVIGKIQDDCIRIFNIEKRDEFKLFTRQLLNNVSSLFELTNISREIEASKKTLENYLEYLKESYVIEVLYRNHKSLIKRGRTLKKIYTPCINFTCALNHYTERSIDEVPQAFGKIIENIVYNTLILKYGKDNISFWRNKDKEIDFLLEKNKRKLAIEVKFSNNINLKELAPLINYIKKKDVEYGVVVTKNEISRKEVHGRTIYFIPYYLILMMI